MSVNAHGNFAGGRLVVFGCGYIGAAVAEQALARGMMVTAVTRNAGSAAALRAGGIMAVVADLADDGWHDQVGGAPEFALNCVSSGGAGAEGYRRSYLEGMASILRWAGSRGRVGTFVYTSSTSVYPDDEGAVVSEGGVRIDAGGEGTLAPPLDDRPAILRAAERKLGQGSGVCDRWFILRLAGIYGPGRHHLLDQVRGGLVSGTGEPHLNLAHRDDIVSAILGCFAASTSVANEIFNVADDGPARKQAVVEWLAQRLNVPLPQFTGAPLGGRRAITPDRVISNEKLKRTLGWRPHFPTFREGYEAMLK